MTSPHLMSFGSAPFLLSTQMTGYGGGVSELMSLWPSVKQMRSLVVGRSCSTNSKTGACDVPPPPVNGITLMRSAVSLVSTSTLCTSASHIRISASTLGKLLNAKVHNVEV